MSEHDRASGRLLVLNAGSSSLKASVLDADETLLFDEDLPVVGGDAGGWLEGVLDRAPAVDAAVHRVVHGGTRFTGAVKLDAASQAALEELRELAPIHNPRAVALIEQLGALRPELDQFACFDTTFHRHLSAAAATYPLPRAWRERWGLRRFGFHGLSHAGATRRVADLLGRPLGGLRVVSAHLGSGASLAAVAGGRSVDTTMGFTPLEGLVMATRSGSVDPGLLCWLLQHGGIGPDELADGLEHEAGLLGLAGSGDLREVLALVERGDADATLGYEVYLHRLRREVGAMVASMAGVDAIVFTGGAGFASGRIRSDACASLGYLGVRLDDGASDKERGDRLISTADSTVAVAAVRAREDIEMARQVRAI